VTDEPKTEPGTVEPGVNPADLTSRRKAHGESLASARRRYDPPPEESQRSRALGMAFKVGVDLVAGLLVGGFLGWYLDSWLGTKPILFLLFIALGAAAGIRSIFRQAYRMNREAGGGPNETAGGAGGT